MFEYWFTGLVTMFPDYDSNTYGVNQETMDVWHGLRKSNPKRFEYFFAIRIFHGIFKSTEVI
jgi:hypothetical protein